MGWGKEGQGTISEAYVQKVGVGLPGYHPTSGGARLVLSFTEDASSEGRGVSRKGLR